MTLKELNESLSPERVIELLEFLGNDSYVDKGEYIMFKTICHNISPQDAKLKLYYYKNTKLFVCYTDCGETFNIFTLFEKRYKLLNKEYNFFRDIVLKIAGSTEFNRTNNNLFKETYESCYRDDIERTQVELEEYNSSVLNIFIEHPVIEWISDGISFEQMKLFNIKYSIEYNKIIIPHYDINNRLIGIRARSLNDEDLAAGRKYMPLQCGGKLYNHPLAYNLYGLNVNKENLKKFKVAIIAEGEKSVLQYGTMFGTNRNICVASCGSSIHSYQVELLVKLGVNKIIIAYDKEGTTSKEKEKYLNKLRTICLKYRNFCQMGYVYDFKNRLGLKESPFDKDKETAENLIKECIWV